MRRWSGNPQRIGYLYSQLMTLRVIVSSEVNGVSSHVPTYWNVRIDPNSRTVTNSPIFSLADRRTIFFGRNRRFSITLAGFFTPFRGFSAPPFAVGRMPGALCLKRLRPAPPPVGAIYRCLVFRFRSKIRSPWITHNRDSLPF